MTDPIRILFDMAPKIAQSTEEIEAAIESLYDAVCRLREHWRTIVVNGEAPAVQEGPAINSEKLPTWQSIRELLTHWRTLDAAYRRAWEQLSDDDRDFVPNLEPDVVGRAGG